VRLVARWRTRRLFVTGGGGFVGWHLIRMAPEMGFEVMAPPSAALDVRNQRSVHEAIVGWKPHAVVHLAMRPGDRRSIVDASGFVAEAAAAARARLVHVSTDMVFSGRPQPYREGDAPFPILDYGRWKADAEARVAAADPGALVVRTSMLFGTDRPGQPQLDVQAALRGGSSMTFFTDEVRCPAHADDLARALLLAAREPTWSGPLHVAGPVPFTRAEFASLVARWWGLSPAALRTGTAEALGLVRPHRLVLDCTLAASRGVHCRDPREVLRA
jgi:dTDP-4-dehydrorhamnose reductase